MSHLENTSAPFATIQSCDGSKIFKRTPATELTNTCRVLANRSSYILVDKLEKTILVNGEVIGF